MRSIEETRTVEYHSRPPFQSTLQPTYQQNSAPKVNFQSNIGTRQPEVQAERSEYPKFKLASEAPSEYPKNSAIAGSSNIKFQSSHPQNVVHSQPNISYEPVSHPDP